VQEWHRTGGDAAGEPVTEHKVVAVAQTRDERVEIREVVAVVGVAHDHELATSRLDAGHESAAVPLLGHVDDASRMNQTQVAEVWPIPADRAEAEAQLQALLARARQDQLHVSIAGARHSMGGHTVAPGGVVIDMLPFKRLELNADKKLLTAGAGARWSDIIPFLDARGLSVGVMQSNHNFSVGGSLSVNCHGWQCHKPPIASTVESFRLMKANGAIVRCSREENKERTRDANAEVDVGK